MPFARLFRSRIAALGWAAGVLWFAYDVADGASPAPDDQHASVDEQAAANAAAADLDALAAVINGA